MKLFPILLTILLIMSISVLGETATYNSTLEAPLCSSGDYTSSTPCSSGTLLDDYYTSESNYPNSVDECHDHSIGLAYSIDQIVAWDTDGDGQLETGDTVQIQFDGTCSEGDDIIVSFWYSLNPEDGDSATWTKVDRVDYDIGDYCTCDTAGCSNFDEASTLGGFSLRTFTISGTPDYVAIRLSVEGDTLGDDFVNGCVNGAGSFPIDGDDLVLAMYQAPTPQTITSITASNINKYNVTLSSVFDFQEATWLYTYWVIDQVNQSKTNYTTGTTHNRVFTGLDYETTYDYELCTESELGTVCSGEENFTTLNRTHPTITSFDATNINQFNATLESIFVFNDATWLDAYWVIDQVNQSKTNYTSGTTHNVVYGSLDWETTYDYEFCIDWELGTICSGEDTFTTSNRTIPYINIAAEFDINQSSVSVGGTFFHEDFENVTAYAQIDGVNQTVTDYLSGSGSQYHSEIIIGLDLFTQYTWDFCITYELGEICEGATIFRTLDWLPPSINIISDFDVTNHEASLGGTALYNDYPNINLGWYLDEVLIATEDFEQSDEFDTSEYYSFNITGLDYATTYDYKLVIRYEDLNYSLQNVTTCETVTQLYSCNGNQDYSYGYTWDTELNFAENGDLCNSYCEQDENSCCALLNGFCYGYDGATYFTDDGSHFSSSCSTNETQAGEILFVNDTDSFTTLAAYIPFISISGTNNLAGDSVTLTGTHYSYDYPSTTPFFRLEDVDLLPKTNITKDYSTPNTLEYDLTGLDTNTTYNYTFCVGYGLGWALLVCDTTKEFTTGFVPTFTWSLPTLVTDTTAELHWTIDYSGATNVNYKLNGLGGWLPAIDGISKQTSLTGLTAETNYSNYVTLQFDTLGDTFLKNTTTQNYTTYYENAMDDIWDTLLQGSSTAKLLLGFVVLLGVVFFGAAAFGQYNIKLGTYGILVLVIIGTALATLMKLFTVGVLLLVFAGAIILAVLKNMFFTNDYEGGR